MSENGADCRWMRLGVVVLVFCPSLIARGYDYGGGSGEPNAPYLIYTPEQMNAIGLHEDDWDRHFMLMADIDLDSYGSDGFNPVGRFKGVFSGNGYAISNFTYTSVSQTYVGLFEWLADPQALIENLILIDPGIHAGSGDHVGALVGYLCKGTVSNCHVIGGVVFADKAVGGLVGSNIGGVITDCSMIGEATGNESIGGLVGMNHGELIANSCASGSVAGNDNVGGLVGTSYGAIANCYADCQVTGRDDVGGLVGHHGLVAICGLLRISMPGTISCCYSVGQVTGAASVGGLVGSNHSGDIDACFWNVHTAGLANMCGSQGNDTDCCTDDNGRITSQMQTSRTFLDAGWDFMDEADNGAEDIWWIDQGRGYPRLWWESVVLIVDDFESYNDDDNYIFETWLDGWVNETGSTVGFDLFWGPERTIPAHSGRQAMPFWYENAHPPHYSEAERTWEPPRDWTIHGADALRLYFCGEPYRGDDPNPPLYVALEDSAGRLAAVVHPDPNAVVATGWVEWNIPFSDFVDVNPAAVVKMYIGVGNRDDPQTGGEGPVYIDDIQLINLVP